jgi:hypothetical protein
MPKKLVIFLVVAFFAGFAHADNAITFHLPRHWTLLSSQIVPGTNTDTHSSFSVNRTVLQDSTTNLTTMMIFAAPATVSQLTNNLAIEARNWVDGVLNEFAENHNFTITKLVVKNEDKKTFAETAFTIQLQDATLYGISRYSMVSTNAIGWVAFGRSTAIETNKVVLGIADSVRLQK